MTVTYNSGTDTVTLSGTQSSPDTLDAIVTAVANTAKAVKTGDATYRFSFAVLNASAGFIQFADDSITILTSVRLDKNGANGGIIFGKRSVVRHEGTGYFTASTYAASGFKYIANRDEAGRNPRFICSATSRYDFFTSNDSPISYPVYTIQGLDVEVASGATGGSCKVYQGSGSSIANLRYFNTVNFLEFQSVSGAISDLFLENATLSTSASTAGNTSTITRCSFYFTGTAVAININFNAVNNTVNLIDPIFPNLAWNGKYSGVWQNSATCICNVSFSSSLVFLSGITPTVMRVQYTRNDAVTITGTADGTGTLAGTQLLTSTRNGAGLSGTVANQNPTASYTWSAKARAYAYTVAGGESIFAALSLSTSRTGSVQCVSVPYLTTSVEATAGSISGIAFAASGATAGTVTISASLTTAQVWTAYRYFISQFANFGSSDSWSFDGTTLSVGGWSVVVSGGTLSGAALASSASITTSGSGQVTAPYTSSAGTAGIFTLSNISAGSSLLIADSGGVQKTYVASTGSSYTLYVPPAAAATWTWKLAKYGSLAATGTFSSSGVSSAVVTQTIDAVITQATAATVAAYTSLSSPDQLYDFAAYYETTSTGIAASRKIAKTGPSADLGAQALTIDANASGPFAVSGTTITIKASTFAPGSTMQSLTTTGAITLSNGALSTAYLTGSGGSNGIITLTGLLAGSAVALLNGSGAVTQSIASSGTTAAFVTPYPSTGSLIYVARRSDQVQDTGSVSASGLSSTATSETPRSYYSSTAPSGIAFASSSATAGTVTITASNTVAQLWSAWAQYIAQSANLALNDTWAYDGVTLNTGAWNIAVSGTGVVLTGNLTTTGTATGSIQGVYTSSAGTSGFLTLTGIQSGSTIYIADNTPASQAFVQSSGTSYTLTIPPATSATWTWKVSKYGFLESTGSFQSAGGATSVTVSQATDTGVTQATVATVAAYTTLETLDKLYDFSAYRQTTQVGIAFSRVVVKSGTVTDLGVRNLVIDATASTPWVVASGTITIAAPSLSAGVTFQTLTTTGAVSTANGATILCIYTDSGGRHVKVTALGLLSGTRVQLWNVTDAVEVDNSVAGASGYVLPLIYSADKTYRLEATYVNGATAMLPLKVAGTFGSLGLAFSVSQTADTVYNAAGIDGSTATEFSADFPNIQVDVSSSGGATTVQRLYAWLVYEQTLASGIRNFFGSISATDSANYVIDQSVVNLQLDNVLSSPVRVTGGYLSRKDGSTVIAPSSGSIQMDPGRAYVAGLSNPLVLSPGERLITNANGKYLARA